VYYGGVSEAYARQSHIAWARPPGAALGRIFGHRDLIKARIRLFAIIPYDSSPSYVSTRHDTTRYDTIYDIARSKNEESKIEDTYTYTVRYGIRIKHCVHSRYRYRYLDVRAATPEYIRYLDVLQPSRGLAPRQSTEARGGGEGGTRTAEIRMRGDRRTGRWNHG
jgi:hypothetical protein